jgi:hypothetical protein
MLGGVVATGPLLRIVCLTALMPSMALAQRGMGGMGGSNGIGRRRPGNIEREPGLAVPKQANAVNLLIEHRQDLALSDSQFAQIAVIKRALDSTNAPLARRLDSLQRVFKGGPIFSEPTPAHRDSLAEARGVALEATSTIGDHISAARERAYALLSPSQLSKAQGFEAAAEKAIEDENDRNSGGGRRGGGRTGRPPESS